MNEQQTNSNQQFPVSQDEQPQIDGNRLLAAICYGVFPPIAVAISVLMMLMKKEDEYIMFHAKQGIVLGAAGIVLMIIPVINSFTTFILFPIIALYAGFQAYQGQKWRIPYLSDWADKIVI
jgi:uncharacterized membrane protein